MTSNEMVNQLNKLLQQSNISNSKQQVQQIQRPSLVNQQNTQSKFSQAFALNNQKIKTRLFQKKDSNSLQSEIGQSCSKNNGKYFMINGKFGEKRFVNRESNEFEEENKENIQNIQIESTKHMNFQIQNECQVNEKLGSFKQLINQIHCKNKGKQY
ncbi:unnamed protein product [Paramecium pentaurelia]|uniref:Uncharacterized protein n=1 Tax=Paramecium pentaurelia TaxID=43138 RepID=A0A8S1TH80_9CILI|nr:unnamed protein product [Paramecium pentaurelia]